VAFVSLRSVASRCASQRRGVVAGRYRRVVHWSILGVMVSTLGTSLVPQLLHGSPRPLRARTAVAPIFSVPRSAEDSVPDSAGRPTFTTAPEVFAPWRHDWVRYDVPGLCVSAARWARLVRERTLAAQASYDFFSAPGERDSLGGSREAAAVARACAAHLPIVPEMRETDQTLDERFHLALLAENDSLAVALVDRLVARAHTAAAKRALWTQAGEEMMSFQGWENLEIAPMRFGALTALLAREQAAGLSDTAAHAFLVRFAGSLLGDLRGTRASRRYADQILALAHARLLAPADTALVFNAYEALLWLAVAEHPDSIPLLVQHAQADLRQFSPTWGAMTSADVLAKLTASLRARLPVPTGGPVPPIQADYWYPIQPGDTVRPVRGTVNLVCAGGLPTLASSGANLNEYHLELRGNLDGGYVQAAKIRRWLQRYGPGQLAITIVQEANGYVMVDEYGRLPQLFTTPAEEAAYWRWYYQDFEQLPVTVAVRVKRGIDTFAPAPDGRRVDTAAASFDLRSYWNTDSAYTELRPPDYWDPLFRVGEYPRFELEEGDRCVVVDPEGRRLPLSQKPNKKLTGYLMDQDLQLILRPRGSI
jgi:hypothetical protein